MLGLPPALNLVVHVERRWRERDYASCLAQEHNMMSLSRIQTGLPDPESRALIMMSQCLCMGYQERNY